MKKTSLILLATVTLFAACRKKQRETNTQQKIVNKWGLVSLVNNDFNNGVSHPTTYTGVAGDYVDFRSDNKVYTSTGGGKDTSTYSIISDKYIKIDENFVEIKTLTDNSFILYSKKITGADYNESSISLKK